MISREFSDEIVRLVIEQEREWIIFGDAHIYANELTLDDIALLGGLIASHLPTTLGLANLALNDEQIIALLKEIEKNTSIKKLYLAFNKISDTGATAIAQFLMRKDCAITQLFLHQNKIGNKGISQIANTLIANDSLTTLELFCNPFNNRVVTDFKWALKSNRKLENLVLFAPNGGEQLPAEILAKLASNQLARKNEKLDSRRSSLFSLGQKQKSLNLQRQPNDDESQDDTQNKYELSPN